MNRLGILETITLAPNLFIRSHLPLQKTIADTRWPSSNSATLIAPDRLHGGNPVTGRYRVSIPGQCAHRAVKSGVFPSSGRIVAYPEMSIPGNYYSVHSGTGDSRRIEGVSPTQAFMRNCRNQANDAKGEVQGKKTDLR
jgi:hypothetical protein